MIDEVDILDVYMRGLLDKLQQLWDITLFYNPPYPKLYYIVETGNSKTENQKYPKH